MRSSFYGLLVGFLVLLAASPAAYAAKLYLSPADGVFAQGEAFKVQIRVDNEKECVNAAQVNLSYDKSLLEVLDVSRGDSIFTLWVSDPFINPKFGTISFSGGIPGGYCGRVSGDPSLTNTIATVVLRFASLPDGIGASPSAAVGFLGGTEVLLNDGLGTPAKLSLEGASFTTKKGDGASRNQWIDEIKKDKVPPEPFSVEVHQDEALFGGGHFIVFSTLDKQSGIDHYEVIESDAQGFDQGGFRKAKWRRVTSPYLLKDQEVRSLIKVRALDKAGNERIGEFVPENVRQAPFKTKSFFWTTAALVISALAAFFRIFILKKL